MVEQTENRKRKVLLNYIIAHPGVSFTELLNILDINKSTLRYHLKYLERKREVTSSIHNGMRHYTCFGASTKETTGVPATSFSGLQSYLLNLIIDNPGITRKALSRLTGLEKHVITYNVEKLVENDLVWKVRRGKNIGYEYITRESLNLELFKLLLDNYLKGEIDKQTFIRLKEELEKRRL